jgi:flap endonuclease-1
MGVAKLNGYIRAMCEKSIKKMPLSQLAGKKVSIDASIFMYRYKEKECLLENMYNLVNVLKKNGIIPCFVFDGKPPDEKKGTITARKEAKMAAEEEHKEVLKRLESIDPSDTESKEELQRKAETLRVKMTRLTVQDVWYVKDLLTACGVTWIEACGEADGLCAKMCVKRYTDAVLSEDMDMFLYGCPYVWRHLSILQETVFVYDLESICSELQVSKEQLKEICVASGTDYNSDSNKGTNIHTTMKLYRRYKKSGCKDQFYEWLDENTDYIDNMCLLYSHLAMFDVKFVYLDRKVVGKRGALKCAQEDREKLKEVLSREDFYFPD